MSGSRLSGLRISESLGGDAGRTDARALLDAGSPTRRGDSVGIVLSVDSESAWLYAEAARLLGFTLEVHESRPFIELSLPPAYRGLPPEMVAEVREAEAFKKGAKTLRKLRKYLRDNELDDPQRQYWRRAQRTHRAINRG